MTEPNFVYCTMVTNEDGDGYPHSTLISVHTTLDGAREELQELQEEAEEKEEESQTPHLIKMLNDIQTEEYDCYCYNEVGYSIFYIMQTPLMN